MSETEPPVPVPAGPAQNPQDPQNAKEPRPEPIRFFGTAWVRHDGGYPLRRAAVAVGSLAAAVAGALVLAFGFQGLAGARVGLVVDLLAAAGFTVCSVLMFRRTWRGYVRRPGDTGPDPDASKQGLYMFGFVGALLAYFVRSLYEAPGERLRRAEYDRARERHERRRAQRTGNPAARAGRPPRP